MLLLNRDDFSLETECGTFIVRKDQLLVGNVHMAHRDSSIFDQPDKFMPSRFEDEVNTTQLLLYNTVLELDVEVLIQLSECSLNVGCKTTKKISFFLAYDKFAKTIKLLKEKKV